MKTHIFKIDKSFDLSLLSDNDDVYNRYLLSLTCQNYIANDGSKYTDLLLKCYKTIYLDEIKSYYNIFVVVEKHNRILLSHEYKHHQFYDDNTKKHTYEIDRIKFNSCACNGTVFTDTVSKYKQYLDNDYYYQFKKHQYHLFINI